MRKNLRDLFNQFGALFFSLLFLLLAALLVFTQEVGDNADTPNSETEGLNPIDGDDIDVDELAEESEEEIPAEWAPLGPPRWFRSNAGGMTLEEIPSRFVALRNEFALVIDYVSPDELPRKLAPFYQDSFVIEIRVLYEQGQDSRQQWLFRDKAGGTRLAAVFDRNPDEVELADGAPPDAAANAISENDAASTGEDNSAAELSMTDNSGTESSAEADDTASVDKSTAEQARSPEQPARVYSSGFIEVYNENYQIAADYQFFEDGGETVTDFFYTKGVLVRAEAERKPSGGDFKKIYTDQYRYNRSAFLRFIERLYHDQVEVEPVRIAFPSRILDAAANDNFIQEQIPLISDFLGDSYAGPGYRTVFTTDDRGRILTQSLLDSEDVEVWVIKNTWSGERISSILKLEGDEELLTEYEYNSAGNRIVERNLRNGVLERLVRSEGFNEKEELYMNGILVIRAEWENGRKISEERVRKQADGGQAN